MKQMSPRSFPVRAVDAYSYQSSAMNMTYDVSVGLPPLYVEYPKKHYPLLIVLDGNDHFSTVNTLARGMLDDINELVIVGVDIPIELDRKIYSKRRVHQFSPDNNWPMTDDFGATLKNYMKEDLGVSDPEEYIGGAPRFYDFLKSELLPDLFREYRINSCDIGLAGNSAAGFFTSYAMFRKGSPFCKYIISSPAMAYGNGEIFRIEKRWKKSHSDLMAKVYIGAGEREVNDERYSRGKIVSGMTKLTSQLLTRNYPNLEIESDIYSGIGHVDSLSATVANGLRYLYQKDSRDV